jgi:hypothetical protein
MWLLFRLLMFVTGIVYRASSLFLKKSDLATFPGNLQLKLENKRVSLTSSKFKSRIHLKIDSRNSFRLVPENTWFKFYKSAGFAREIQVGDPEFDRKFYVAAENRGFMKRLRSDKALRDSLIKLHNLGFNRFISNGNGYLEIDNPSTAIDDPTGLLQDLEQIKSSLNTVEKSSFFDEPTRAFVLLFELIFYGLVGYYAGTFIRLITSALTFNAITEGVIHLDIYDYFLKGLITSGVLISILVILTLLLFRRTSLAPLVFYDFVFPASVLSLIVGIQLFGDLNRLLDRSPTVLTEAYFEKKFTKDLGGRWSRSSGIQFFINLRFRSNPSGIPGTLSVSPLLQAKLIKGDGVEIETRRGFFDSPYIEEIRMVAYPKKLDPTSKIQDQLDYSYFQKIAKWTAEQEVSMEGPPKTLVWEEVRYSSGQLQVKAPIVDGTLTGTAEYWFENGARSASISWLRGQMHGRAKFHNEKNRLTQSNSYRFGKLHGLSSWYNDKGEVTQRTLYEEDQVISYDQKILDALAKEVGEF